MKYQGSATYVGDIFDGHMQWLFLGLDASMVSATQPWTAQIYDTSNRLLSRPIQLTLVNSGSSVSFNEVSFEYTRESTVKGIHLYNTVTPEEENFTGMLTPGDDFYTSPGTPAFSFQLDDNIAVTAGDTVTFPDGTFHFSVTMVNGTSLSNYGLNGVVKRLLGIHMPVEERWLAFTDESGDELTAGGYARLNVGENGYPVADTITFSGSCTIAGWVLHRHETSNLPVLDGTLDRTIDVISGDQIRPGYSYTAPTWQYGIKLVN